MVCCYCHAAVSSVMGALSNASHNVPYVKEDIKTVLEHIRKSREPDDKVYVYYGADMAFRYYQARYDIPDDAVIRGKFLAEDMG